MGSDPDILVDLTTAKSDFEAQVIVESLRGQGIAAEAFTTAGTALPLHVGSSLPFRIAVRRRDLASAGAALRALRAESVDIDWDEVDVAEAEAEAGVRPAVKDGRRRRWWAVVAVTLYLLCAVVMATPVYNVVMFLLTRYASSVLRQWTPGWFVAAYLLVIVVIGCAVALAARRGR